MTHDREGAPGPDLQPATKLTEETIAAAEAEAEESSTAVSPDLTGMEDPVLCFRIGPTWFAVAAVEALEVNERTKIFSLPRAPTYVPGVINEGGRVTPLLDLLDFLQVPLTSAVDVEVHEALTGRIVVVAADGMRVGIICDRVTGVMEFAKDRWRDAGSEVGEHFQAVVDAVIQSQLGLVMVLNVPRLLEAARVR